MSDLKIKHTDLPVTCKLQNPPNGVTIALAQMFDATGATTDLAVSADGQSFVIPNTITAGNWTLEVRVKNGRDPIPPIDVVEDCGASQRILTIVDPVSKMGQGGIEVLNA
jgi:hypothetical protein